VFRNSASVARSIGDVQADEESIELKKKKNKKEQNQQLEVPFLFCAICVIISATKCVQWFHILNMFSARRDIQKTAQHSCLWL